MEESTSFDFQCKECAKTYKHYRNLREHVKKFHLDSLSELAPCLKEKKTFEFSCNLCNKNFNHLVNLRSHKRKMHGDVSHVEKDTSSLTCPICQDVILQEDKFTHFNYKHDIAVQIIHHEFASFDIFSSWKDGIEKETKNSFVKKRGDYKTKNFTKHYFKCHRSGEFHSQSSGIRHLKLQGSKKIGSYCPAEIIVTVSNDSGSVNVEFVETHVGHDNELSHINLTTNERQLKASKIAAKVPFDSILDDIRDSFSEEGLQRIHLLTKKDLFNITSSFNLNSDAVFHKDDATSVAAWVNKMNAANENSCVLLYKAQGTLKEDYPQLEANDFILVIMNHAQSEMLKLYGSQCICIDMAQTLHTWHKQLRF